MISTLDANKGNEALRRYREGWERAFGKGETDSELGALPSIQEMSGLVEDFTEGMSLGEYLDAIADE